jgi:hypothetical protein
MTVPATRVLAFPGIDLERLTELRAQASDAFLREDFTAYQDACTMIRKLIGGQDASETGARTYRHREKERRRRSLSQQERDRLSANIDQQKPSAEAPRCSADGGRAGDAGP